jgi:hypothetical protein
MSLPIHIIALGRWLKRLTDKDRIRLAPYINGGGKPLNEIARVLTGIDLLQAKPNESFTVTDLAKKYCDDIIWLQENVQFDVWRQAVATNLGVWYGSFGWLNRTGKGEYKRVAILPSKSRGQSI